MLDSLRPNGWNSSGKNTGVVAIPFSTRPSPPRNQTCVSSVSCSAGGFFTVWATHILLLKWAKELNILPKMMCMCPVNIEHMLNTSRNKRSASENHERLPHTMWARMKKTDYIKGWRGGGVPGISLYFCWQWEILRPFWKTMDGSHVPLPFISESLK